MIGHNCVRIKLRVDYQGCLIIPEIYEDYLVMDAQDNALLEVWSSVIDTVPNIYYVEIGEMERFNS